MRVSAGNLFKLHSSEYFYGKNLDAGNKPLVNQISFQSGGHTAKKAGTLFLGFLMSISSMAAQAKKNLKVVEKVENYIAAQYVKGQKTILKDSTAVFDSLKISKNDKQLVKDMLSQYEEQGQRGYLAAMMNRNNISPRKQKLQKKVLYEFAKKFFATGEILKASDVEQVLKAAKVKKAEVPYFKLFLDPLVNINKKTYVPDDFYKNCLK